MTGCSVEQEASFELHILALQQIPKQPEVCKKISVKLLSRDTPMPPVLRCYIGDFGPGYEKRDAFLQGEPMSQRSS